MTTAGCSWPKVRLVEPTLGELRLNEGGYDVQRLDLGPTVARVVSANRTDASGAIDSTKYTGARNLSMTVLLLQDQAPAGVTLQDLADDLGAYANPALVVELYYQAREGEEERRCVVRGNSSVPALAAPLRRYDVVQTSWRWPDGVQESPEIIQTFPAGGVTSGGLHFPRHYPRTYPPAATTGLTHVVNTGKLSVLPVWRLYGPATNPRIESRTIDARLELTANGGLVLGAGEYVEVDMRNRTVRLAGDPAQSRFRQVDLAVSEWWPLVPGDNIVRYYPQAFDLTTAAMIRYRPARA